MERDDEESSSEELDEPSLELERYEVGVVVSDLVRDSEVTGVCDPDA